MKDQEKKAKEAAFRQQIDSEMREERQVANLTSINDLCTGWCVMLVIGLKLNIFTALRPTPGELGCSACVHRMAIY